jgi:isoquinoline 1-oxidoreductase beta subunit
MREIINLSRRDFMKAGALLGGGLMLGFHIPVKRPWADASDLPAGPFMPNAFMRIDAGGIVTVIVGRSEMGQGVYTALPMLVAEELEADWTKIRVESAPVDPAYFNTALGMQATGGSTSVWSSWEQLRKAGAAARMMLVAAAAKAWQVDPETCRAENGYVFHEATKKRLSYGQLAEKAGGMDPPKEVPLKEPKDFKIIGKPLKRLDTPEKTNGRAVFGMDVSVPGMLTAVVARPPVFGARVKRFNADETLKVPGVKMVVRIENGVAVVADGFWQATLGREALKIDWDEGPLSQLSTDGLRKQYAELAGTPGAVARKEGEIVAGVLARSAKYLEAEYEVPFLAHACMEPLNCLVDLRPDGCDIYTGTQFQSADRDVAAQITGLRPDQVKIHTMFLGGGFGRRANPQSDFVSEAVKVAKTVMKPVKVIWTREDDMKGGYYRPMWYDRIAAGLDAKGNPIAWHHTIVGQSIMAGTAFEQTMVRDGVDGSSVEGAKEIPYDIPNILVDLHSPGIGVPVQWWRSVGHSHTAFVVESFMDEVAHAAGKDPYHFRRDLLSKHPRHRAVLDFLAEKSQWGKPLTPGRFRGMALHESFKSIIGQIAEVSVSEEGGLRVHKVVCAVDCGMVTNPDTIEAQMQGAIVFGLSAALHGEIIFKSGRVEQSNFDDYEILRMDEMPLVEVHIVPSKEFPGGVGEPGVPPIAPAVANAIFAATGKRIRRLPIRLA